MQAIEEETHNTDTNSASVSDSLLTSNSNELYQDADIQMLIGNEPSVEANYVEDMLRSEGDTLVRCISVDDEDEDEDEDEAHFNFNESIFDRVEEDGTSASVAGSSSSRQWTVSKPKQIWSEQYCELEVSGECESIHTHHDPSNKILQFLTICLPYTRYKIFFEAHGHCNVPKSYCKKLERWVKRQRGLMRKYEAGDEVGSISVCQYQLLQAIELNSTSDFLYCWYLCAPTLTLMFTFTIYC